MASASVSGHVRYFQTLNARGRTRSGQMGGAESPLGSPARGLTTARLRRAKGQPVADQDLAVGAGRHAGPSAGCASQVQGVAGRYHGGFAAQVSLAKLISPVFRQPQLTTHTSLT